MNEVKGRFGTVTCHASQKNLVNKIQDFVTFKNTNNEDIRYVAPHFIREYIFLSLFTHENIAKAEVFECNVHTCKGLLCMENGGISLYQWIKEYMFDVDVFLKMVYQSAKVLHFLHEKNMIHADLSINNIVFNPETNCVKVIDWGAVIMDATVCKKNVSSVFYRCNPTYTSPEMQNLKYSNDSEITAKHDIFSLGLVLLCLLRGGAELKSTCIDGYVTSNKLPDLQTELTNLMTFSKYFSCIPVEFQLLLSRMLHIDPATRPTAEEICQHPVFSSYQTVVPTTEGVRCDTSNYYLQDIECIARDNERMKWIDFMYLICIETFNLPHLFVLSVRIFDNHVFTSDTCFDKYELEMISIVSILISHIVLDSGIYVLNYWKHFLSEECTDHELLQCVKKVLNSLHGKVNPTWLFDARLRNITLDESKMEYDIIKLMCLSINFVNVEEEDLASIYFIIQDNLTSVIEMSWYVDIPNIYKRKSIFEILDFVNNQFYQPFAGIISAFLFS